MEGCAVSRVQEARACQVTSDIFVYFSLAASRAAARLTCGALRAVLGQFLQTLCEYCSEQHNRHHAVNDFWIYEFAKVGDADPRSLVLTSGMPRAMRRANGQSMVP
jgi:hypothetical protein